MAEFMVMVLADEAEEGRLTPSETKALVEGHARYERKLREAAAFRDGERLRPSAEGRRVGVRDGKVRVESGPFAERALSAYYLVQADSLDAAVELAKQCPMAPKTSIDVRPVMNAAHIKPEKTSHRGRVFAFVVLGRAPNEAAWVEVMDRIDLRTHDRFPDGGFLGGLRLHAPGKGRQVAATGGHRAVFDGPFLESKEVIGGVFFMRMANIEEAVEWAKQSEFMRDGSLEIRELWRS